MRFRYYLIIFLALLPIITLRDFTPDNELRYLSIADEALKNNHFFAFTSHGLPYADKPPLYLWIVMLGKSLFGMHNIWFLSLFSIIPAFAVIYLMDRWTEPCLPQPFRTAAALMLMTSVFFIGGALVLRMDMLMCLFIVLALRTFYKMYIGTADTYDPWLFPFYIFMAVFTKGPLGLLLPVLSTVAFLVVQKEIRTIGKYWGWKTLLIPLGGFALWFAMVWLEGGSAYLNNLLFNQTVNRAVDSFRHKEPFYYYIATIWHSLAPWSLLFAFTIMAGIRQKSIMTDLERFFLTIICTCFVVLSLISSKIGIYMLPAYPFIAYLSVIILSRTVWNKWAALTIAIPAALLMAAAPAAMIWGRNYWTQERALTGCTIAAAILLVAGGFVVLWLLYNKKNIISASFTLAGALLGTIFMIGLATPLVNDRIGYGAVCLKGMELSKGKKAPSYCVYNISRAENMDVYLHTQVKEIAVEDILSCRYPGAILFVNGKGLQKEPSLNAFLKTKKQQAAGDYIAVQL